MFLQCIFPTKWNCYFYCHFVKKSNPDCNPQTPIWEMQKSFFSVFSPQNEITIFTAIFVKKKVGYFSKDSWRKNAPKARKKIGVFYSKNFNPTFAFNPTFRLFIFLFNSKCRANQNFNSGCPYAPIFTVSKNDSQIRGNSFPCLYAFMHAFIHACMPIFMPKFMPLFQISMPKLMPLFHNFMPLLH